MAYTVDDAIAAVASAQAAQPPDKAAYIQASVSITDAGAGTVKGTGPLMIPFYATALLGNLGWVADPQFKFLMQRAANPPQFLLGLDIEPIITIGPVVLRPPAFIIPLLRRLGFFFRRRYQGHFALYLQYQQPHFNVVLTESLANPRLTGTISSSAVTPGLIVPPGAIEVVLESVAIADVFQ
ncbi:hypothetical protein BH18ACT14_BH18ACT14_04350 [soil metagenome]